MTTAQDYRTTITVPTTAANAFNAICSVTEWWTKNIDGNTRNQGDVFTVNFGEAIFVEMEISELIPSSKIIWHVTNCNLTWLQDKTEWTGTKVIWNVEELDGKTTIAITHEGLTPKVECFEDCKQGWDHFVSVSLFKLITEGTGVYKQ